ncbi:MAG: hypothetical protein D6773_05585 [Alphaproteobacteria bacterium]|nr:MAG: hypothetical protein D6773_05585 [Alphaproteobacteria bacterium]
MGEERQGKVNSMSEEKRDTDDLAQAVKATQRALKYLEPAFKKWLKRETKAKTLNRHVMEASIVVIAMIASRLGSSLAADEEDAWHVAEAILEQSSRIAREANNIADDAKNSTLQ